MLPRCIAYNFVVQLPDGLVRILSVRVPVTCRVMFSTELSTLKEWEDINSWVLSTWRRVTWGGNRKNIYNLHFWTIIVYFHLIFKCTSIINISIIKNDQHLWMQLSQKAVFRKQSNKNPCALYPAAKLATSWWNDGHSGVQPDFSLRSWWRPKQSFKIINNELTTLIINNNVAQLLNPHCGSQNKSKGRWDNLKK